MAPLCPACGLGVEGVGGRPVHGYSRLMICPGCRSEFLSPQPDDARLGEIYGPGYYEPWHWEEATVVRAMKAKTFLRALAFVNPARGSRLLDVGCAQGEFAAAAIGLGMKVTGVDLNGAAIDVARDRVPGATFVCGELDAQTVGSDWEVITMFDFIEHVRSPVSTLTAAASVLSPGGRLLISTPRVGSALHQITRRSWPQYREEHLTLFSLDGLRTALARAGLTIVRTRPTTKYVSFAYLLGQASSYTPGPVRSVAQSSRGVLAARITHRVVPFRFGEMTVVASRSLG